MKRPALISAGLFLLAAVLAACGSGGENDQQATARALSESINQTATVEAGSDVGSGAAVQTAEAGATARAQEIAATQAAESAQAAEAAEATAAAIAPIQEELPTYGIDPAEGNPGWVHPPLNLSVEGYLEYDAANFYLGTLVGDFVISSDITWDTATGLAGCGFVLRSDGNEELPNQYLAIATRAGNGSVAFIKQIGGGFLNTQVQSVGGFDPNFDWQNGATNRLTVVARGEAITIYTNGAPIREFPAAEFDRGFVAMVALSESGTTTCDFNNTWMWNLD